MFDLAIISCSLTRIISRHNVIDSFLQSGLLHLVYMAMLATIMGGLAVKERIAQATPADVASHAVCTCFFHLAAGAGKPVFADHAS